MPPRPESQEELQEEIFSPPGHGPHKVTLTKKTTHTRSWTETIFSPMFSFWPFQAEDKEAEGNLGVSHFNCTIITHGSVEAKDEESGALQHREVINYESSSSEEEIEEHDGNKTTKKLIIHKSKAKGREFKFQQFLTALFIKTSRSLFRRDSERE
jgi:hypothetical protein